jgi:hypothetical protein
MQGDEVELLLGLVRGPEHQVRSLEVVGARATSYRVQAEAAANPLNRQHPSRWVKTRIS